MSSLYQFLYRSRDRPDAPTVVKAEQPRNCPEKSNAKTPGRLSTRPNWREPPLRHTRHLAASASSCASSRAHRPRGDRLAPSMKKKAAIVQTMFRGRTMAMPLCSTEDATHRTKPKSNWLS